MSVLVNQIRVVCFAQVVHQVLATLTTWQNVLKALQELFVSGPLHHRWLHRIIITYHV